MFRSLLCDGRAQRKLDAQHQRFLSISGCTTPYSSWWILLPQFVALLSQGSWTAWESRTQKKLLVGFSSTCLRFLLPYRSWWNRLPPHIPGLCAENVLREPQPTSLPSLSLDLLVWLLCLKSEVLFTFFFILRRTAKLHRSQTPKFPSI